MTTTSTTAAFDTAALRAAIERRDAGAQRDAYAPNATLTIVDPAHTPSRPQLLSGAAEIGAHLSDVCDRDMTHSVRTAALADGHLTVEVECTYPDGMRVLCLSVAGIEQGQIQWQRLVQVWDD